VGTPGNLGTSCGICGGTVNCQSQCSINNGPAGDAFPIYSHSFTAGLGGDSENRTYGGACPNGGIRDACIVTQTNTAYLLGWNSSDPHDCTCLYHIGGNALGNIGWTVEITYYPCE
jgi:hypothetical protein